MVVPWARFVLESEVDLCWGEWDSVAACGGGVLWLAGFPKQAKDLVGGENRAIV